ncbi:polyubiquitin-like [Trichomycterus rosablanca]|uniref:polyubiquitin-like n=1 Tax=Trichomycterus rosablanca TaxID=2290929 RepID=UPI002F35CE00
MELIITLLSGETRSVYITPTTTIGDLKRTIAQMYNTRTSRLMLSITNGRIIQLDHDQRTVSDYGLVSGSTVMLLISATSMPFQVFVKNENGQTKTYEVTDEETVDQLMRKVSQIEGVPVDQQRLIFNGQQLQSGRRLQDYNITPESTIHMTLRLRGG